MNSSQRKQRGASAIAGIIIIAIFGAGIYIGLQFIPQYIEAGTVDSILENIEKAHRKSPVSNADDIRSLINKQLNINDLNELKNNFQVTQDGKAYIVKVSYEWKLNLIYEQKPMMYEKAIILD
ncbi:MAG TPA: DUF4845 domain-containing protein [Gammaproteobacteria bacterium]|nr:DUF4845 domain-containing protein [Gammaproteobacteria bacterium]